MRKRRSPHRTSSLWDEYLREREMERQRQLKEERRLAQASRPAIAVRLGDALTHAHERLAHPVVLARLSEVGDWPRYDTLLADRESDLTRWMTRLPDQAGVYRSLHRFNMYPLILNPSGRMGFGRVTVTRISYVRSVVGWTAPKTFSGMTYRLRVEFPEEDFETANLHITLRSMTELPSARVKLLVRFDGIEADLVDHEIAGVGLLRGLVPGSGWRALAPEDVVASFASPDTFKQLMKAAFASFKYKELGIDRHNAGDFFPAGWVRVTLIEYAGQPVLVVSA
jgi:hypothetical protein